MPKVSIDYSLCNKCRICEALCTHFVAAPSKNGITIYVANPNSCQGCRRCERLCPMKAIQVTNDSQ